MALWYLVDRDKWTQAALARADIGADVYLACPGPSLNDAHLVAQPGIFLAAINTAYPLVRPDVWFGMDDPQCYDRRLWSEGFLKIYRGNYRDRAVEGRLVAEAPLAFFMDMEEIRVDEIFARRAQDIKFGWFKHTLGAALHGLVWLGAKRIHLVGCDMGGASDYWYGSPLTPAQRAGNLRLYGSQIQFLRRFAQHGQRHGVDLVSCTARSPINDVVPYVPLEAALAASVAGVPAPGVPRHPSDVAPSLLHAPRFTIHSVREGFKRSRAGARHGGQVG